MVIIWAPKAQQCLLAIALYYEKERSNKAAIKIISRIKQATTALAKFPEMAPIESLLSDMFPIFRSLVVAKQYKVIYTIDKEKNHIHIITIWDCRQNPDKLREDIKNS